MSLHTTPSKSIVTNKRLTPSTRQNAQRPVLEWSRNYHEKNTHYISTRGNGPLKQETFPKGTVFIAMRPSSTSIAPPDSSDYTPSQLHSSSPLRLPIADYRSAFDFDLRNCRAPEGKTRKLRIGTQEVTENKAPGTKSEPGKSKKTPQKAHKSP